MEQFYKDKKRVFECNITVEGADIDNTSARLIMEFDSQTLLFKGSVDSDGKCSIEIPALKNIKEEKGKATLEVISDSQLFEAWESDFILKESKTVKVEMVTPKQAIVENKIKVTAQPIKENLVTKNNDFENRPIVKSFVYEMKKQKINETNVRTKNREIKNIFSSLKKTYSGNEITFLYENIKQCLKLLK